MRSFGWLYSVFKNLLFENISYLRLVGNWLLTLCHHNVFVGLNRFRSLALLNIDRLVCILERLLLYIKLRLWQSLKTLDYFLEFKLVRKVFSYVLFNSVQIDLFFSVLYVVAFIYKIVVSQYLVIVIFSELFDSLVLRLLGFVGVLILVVVGIAAASTSSGLKP